MRITAYAVARGRSLTEESDRAKVRLVLQDVPLELLEPYNQPRQGPLFLPVRVNRSYRETFEVRVVKRTLDDAPARRLGSDTSFDTKKLIGRTKPPLK